MTRKRFIKLLMSKGYSRNMAQSKALLSWGTGKPYKESFEAIEGKKICIDTFKGVTDVLEFVGKVSEALSEGLKAFSRAYTTHMESPSYQNRYQNFYNVCKNMG